MKLCANSQAAMVSLVLLDARHNEALTTRHPRQFNGLMRESPPKMMKKNAPFGEEV